MLPRVFLTYAKLCKQGCGGQCLGTLGTRESGPVPSPVPRRAEFKNSAEFVNIDRRGRDSVRFTAASRESREHGDGEQRPGCRLRLPPRVPSVQRKRRASCEVRALTQSTLAVARRGRVGAVSCDVSPRLPSPPSRRVRAVPCAVAACRADHTCTHTTLTRKRGFPFYAS